MGGMEGREGGLGREAAVVSNKTIYFTPVCLFLHKHSLLWLWTIPSIHRSVQLPCSMPLSRILDSFLKTA